MDRFSTGDIEQDAALAYLIEKTERYTVGQFTPPFAARKREEQPVPILAMMVTIGRRSLRGGGHVVRRLTVSDGETDAVMSGSTGDMAASFSASVLRAKHSGTLIVTSDSGRHVLDVWLDTLGEILLRMGYSLQPMMTAGNVSFIVIRKGRSKWTVATFEGVSGRPVSCGLEYAEIAGYGKPSSRPTARHIWSATYAYAEWLASTFGCALHPTVGMTAMSAARSSMDRSIRKWRPEPLRVAFEREGRGYRGGITYGRTYRGPTWRIDVNRQYTHALRQPLPLRSAFGRVPDVAACLPWVAVCRVQLGGSIPYPLAAWDGPDVGFRVQYHADGAHVCVLHSAESAAILESGGTVQPGYGYVSSATFTFSDYVELLQAQIREHGRDDPRASFAKPLGNYVYGKFGQLTTRTELLYSDENPGPQWYPYWAPDGTAWESVWERETEHVGMANHVDIAATITAYARAQTVAMWASLSNAGLTVVRCHTDSLTVTGDPTAYVSLSDTQIGSWRLENMAEDSLIVGSNVYYDGENAHVAGVSNPTYEMVERLASGGAVTVSQTMKMPRHGLVRGESVQERVLQASRAVNTSASQPSMCESDQ